LNFTLRQHVAFVDPYFHADDSISRQSSGNSVINVGAKSVQRNALFCVPLGTSDLCTIKTSCDLNFNTANTATNRSRHRLFQSSTPRNTLLKLNRDVFRNKLSIHVRLTNFLNIDEHFVWSQALNIGFKLVNSSSFFPNNNT